MSTLPPAAFMSYVHFDDQHEHGRLSEFCRRLSGEVRLHTGEEFPIFLDQDDIAWGQQWQERLNESLDAVTFLIPIITPSFFKRPVCRAELERFLEREKQLRRNDLILPVYYINCPLLNDEAQRAADPLAQIIAARQRADWRELRFKPFNSPLVGRMLATMAQQIIAALARQPAAHLPIAGGASETPQGPAVKTQPPTRVVDALHRGDHPTLTEALRAANPGDRILVRPGFYQEGVLIDKPVEIIGDGPADEIVIQAVGKSAILFQTDMGRVSNLTLRQAGGGRWFCVDIVQGRLDLEGCDISSQSLACVGIHAGADPRLRRNRIHDGREGGVYVYENGQGTLEDNDIFANGYAGVEIQTGGNPTLICNRIHDGRESGVYVYENGRGTLEDNEIFANACSGVEIRAGGNPTLRKNRIRDGKGGGVHVYGNGRGTLEDNDILANAYSGVTIKTGGSPTLRKNRITRNLYSAIRIYEGGGGVFEGNDLRGNQRGAWDISSDSETAARRTQNQG